MESSSKRHSIGCHAQRERVGNRPVPHSVAGAFALGLSAIALWLFSSGALDLRAGQKPSDQSARFPDGISVVSQRGYYLVQYQTEPHPIPLNEMFKMQVAVRERHKKSLAKRVKLDLDAGMLAHNHGMNTLPKIAQNADGSFHVTGMLFHMPGKWNLTFHIARGLLKDKARMDVVLE